MYRLGAKVRRSLAMSQQDLAGDFLHDAVARYVIRLQEQDLRNSPRARPTGDGDQEATQKRRRLRMAVTTFCMQNFSVISL